MSVNEIMLYFFQVLLRHKLMYFLRGIQPDMRALFRDGDGRGFKRGEVAFFDDQAQNIADIAHVWRCQKNDAVFFQYARDFLNEVNRGRKMFAISY